MWLTRHSFCLLAGSAVFKWAPCVVCTATLFGGSVCVCLLLGGAASPRSNGMAWFVSKAKKEETQKGEGEREAGGWRFVLTHTCPSFVWGQPTAHSSAPKSVNTTLRSSPAATFNSRVNAEWQLFPP
jgi:hypothetical protein